MKVTIKAGVGNTHTIEVAEGTTVEMILGKADTIAICGEQHAARIDGTDVPLGTTLRDGDVVEPVSKANEKAAL